MKFIVLALALIGIASASFQCLDENGQAVDWFVVLKAPTISTSLTPFVPAGLAYFYVDSNSATMNMTLSAKSIGDSSSAIGRTLDQIHQASGSKDSFGWAYYNDETPSGTVSSFYAHSKGVIAFGPSSGFWLVHSVPKFPEGASVPYSYVSTGTTYGQSFLCQSYGISYFEEIGKQLTIMNPQIYDSNMPSSLSAQLPSLTALFKNQGVPVAPYRNVALYTLKGNKFMSFAKSASYNADLYSSIVSPVIHSGLLLETWMRPLYASCCPPSCAYPSINVLNTKFPNTDISYSYTKDHSKYGSSIDPSVANVCIGGINRQLSQFTRGGGTVCQFNPDLWAYFQAIISTSDSCN